MLQSRVSEVDADAVGLHDPKPFGMLVLDDRLGNQWLNLPTRAPRDGARASQEHSKYECRRLAPVLPFAQASLGRLHWSGDMRYTYVGLGAGAELFLAERLAVRLGLRGTWPVADGRRNVGPDEAPVYRTARLDAAQLRLSVGICWHLRRRGETRGRHVHSIQDVVADQRSASS